MSVIDRSTTYALDHPLIAVLVVLEVLFILLGIVLEAIAQDVTSGSTTTLAHVAGILGALAVTFAVIGIVSGLAYATVFRLR